MMASTLSSSPAPFLLSKIRIPASPKPAIQLHPSFPTWVHRKPLRSLRASVKGDDKPYDTEDQQEREEFIGLEILEQFIQLNVGSWSGHFTQYDAVGNALQRIPTRLAADSYGKGEQVSLYQTLNIKQPSSKTYITDETVEDDGWAEFKLGETNLLTIDRRQQVGYFPSEKAYTVSHQTAEMLDKVLRAGVLGEDSDIEKEFPKR